MTKTHKNSSHAVTKCLNVGGDYVENDLGSVIMIR
jgi:hypothetical protein